ncbi:hypothetical protein LEN26_007696 [Aphanomyces euteiches]|nr:hypothetical protein AeMF1_001502 [Aphanomyces euteiches]KAH9131454.1 hypothetical protein LEN26_007696 [Aphanomyces euteiches]KAH9197130.1 hypothetical protein AeNC1_000892 [Aphanomyces euteiches]
MAAAVESIRLTVLEDPRVAGALVVGLIMLTWLILRHFSKASTSRLHLNDLARVECLSTGRLMHKIVLPPREASNTKTLVLMIPGNPGVPGFYEPFMRHMHQLSGQDVEIVGLSHTGHSLPWINNDETFDLETQVVDKLAYIQKRLERDSSLRLVLIGHSIGGHIALRLLNHYSAQIDKLVLIQPTLMHIGDTPNGKRLTPIFNRYSLVSSVVGKPIGMLPTSLKKLLVPFFVGPAAFHKPALSLVEYAVLLNCLKMAWHEVQELKEIDDGLVKAHQEKMLFVFAEYDGWCPPEQVEILQSRYTQAKHVTVALPHAFMLGENGSEVMGNLVWEWLSAEKMPTAG